MTTSYEITVFKVEPSGTELADKIDLLFSARFKESDHQLASDLFEVLSKHTPYRIYLEEVRSEVAHKKIRFKRASGDNPFVE